MKHYLNGSEINASEMQSLIDLAIDLKNQPQRFAQGLNGISIVGLFEKPSLRTRVSFEIGLHRLGAQALYLDHQNERIGTREAVRDYARNLSVWSQGIFARVFQHETLQELANHARVPVVNALCDRFHPCQALADVMTMQEKFGSLKNLKLAYIGDGNNVCHSLMLAASQLGAHITVLTPVGHGPQTEVLVQTMAQAKTNCGSLQSLTHLDQLGTQDVIYTDTWISMGAKLGSAQAQAIFSKFQINEALMQQTKATMFLHCQPAHRGVEVSDAVMDSKASFLLQQAENRMHTQNALWLKLLNRV